MRFCFSDILENNTEWKQQGIEKKETMFDGISLKYRMILGSGLAVIIPFLVAGTIIYVQLSKSLIDHTQEDNIEAARDIASFIDSYLNQKIQLASVIAASPETIKALKTSDYGLAQKILDSIYDRIGNTYFTIFITDKDGIARAEAVFPEQIGLDLSDRLYFQNARNGRASIAEPLLPKGTATPGEPILMLAVPIVDDNEFLGIVGLPFNTDFITKILSRSDIEHTAEAFLINEDGLVLIHPRKELILNLHLLDQPGTQEIKALIQAKTGGAVSFRLNDVEKIAGLAHIDSTGWIALFSQNRDEALLPLKKILYSIFFSGLVFLVFTIGIIVVLSGKISSPIDKNLEVMRQVTIHSNETIAQIGLDRKIIFVNAAYEKFSGLNAEQIIGSKAVFNPVEHSATPVWEMLEDGTPWSGRLSVTKNGDVVTREVMAVPLRDGGGTIQGYLEIGRDITAELMYEKRLQQSQKMEAIGTLAGGIAHDFNNILAGIFGYAELCLMKKHSPNHTEKYIKEILIASERARELVSQILSFSRKADIELRPISPKSVLKEALNLLRATIPATIDIQTKIQSNSAILANPTQFHQVIMNLFTNAVHAIGENKGKIKVELEDLYVDEEFVATHPNVNPGNHVIIRISDTGTGIEEAALEHIFEPFYTTKPQGEGAGLGLSVVHGIVKSFNGIITAYSQLGEGTSFNIIIPSLEFDVTKLHEKETSSLEGNERIVFVDDEEVIVSAMKAILSNLGYTVTTFVDSENALQAIQEKPGDFDVIITDYSMPKLTGLELAQKVIDTGIQIPIILTSGFFGENIEEKAHDIGILYLITKPIDTYKITRAIHLSQEKGKNPSQEAASIDSN